MFVAVLCGLDNHFRRLSIFKGQYVAFQVGGIAAFDDAVIYLASWRGSSFQIHLPRVYDGFSRIRKRNLLLLLVRLGTFHIQSGQVIVSDSIWIIRKVQPDFCQWQVWNKSWVVSRRNGLYCIWINGEVQFFSVITIEHEFKIPAAILCSQYHIKLTKIHFFREVIDDLTTLAGNSFIVSLIVCLQILVRTEATVHTGQCSSYGCGSLRPLIVSQPHESFRIGLVHALGKQPGVVVQHHFHAIGIVSGLHLHIRRQERTFYQFIIRSCRSKTVGHPISIRSDRFDLLSCQLHLSF